MSPRLFSVAASLLWAAALVSPSLAGDVPRVRVASVELPPKKDGGRDLRHAMGPEAEAAAASAVAAGLRATTLVEVPATGEVDLLLAVRIERARTRPDDRSAIGAGTSLIEVRATVTWDWTRGGATVQSGRLERERLHEHAGRIDTPGLALAWQELLAEVGEAITLETGASGAFSLTAGGGTGGPSAVGSSSLAGRPKRGG